MRRVLVQELISVDGFVADLDGGLDFFDAVRDYGEVHRDNLAALTRVDTILLGATTYRLFASYWPTAEGEAMAEMINATPKVVVSSTLTEAPWGAFKPAVMVRGEAAEHVDRLRQGSGGDVVVWGSISLAQSLFAADLVDELSLRVVPVVIGAGRTLLTAEQARRDLVLLGAKPYGCGIVSLRYAPAHAVGEPDAPPLE